MSCICNNVRSSGCSFEDRVAGQGSCKLKDFSGLIGVNGAEMETAVRNAAPTSDHGNTPNISRNYERLL